MKTPATYSALVTLSAALLVGLATLPALPGTLRADDLKDGRTALQQGRLDDAARSFEKAAGQGSPEGRAGVGQVFLKRQQYEKATEQFLLAQKMDPNVAIGYWGEGEVLRQQDNCDKAVPLLQRAVDLDRKFPEAQLALSDCLMRLKRYDEAVASATRGVGWGEKWRPKFLVALGNIEASRDSLGAARTYLYKAREEAPDDPTIRRALGDFYVSRGTFESAFPEYQAAVALDSTDIELRFSLAQAYYHAKRYSDALEQFQAVVVRDPEFAPGQFALGNLLYLSGKADPRKFADRFDQAKAPLEKYTQLNPRDSKGWSLLGRVEYFIARGSNDAATRDRALADLSKAEELGDKSKEMYTIRARLQSERKEYAAALSDYQRGEPELEDQLRLAQIYNLLKQPAAAESVYAVIVAADSTSWGAKMALGEMGKTRFRAGDYPGAIALLQRRIALDPGNDEAYYYLGLSYKQLKEYPEALAALRQAAALADTKADRHFWLGIMLAQAGSRDSARTEFMRVTEIDTTCSANSALAYQQLGLFRLLEKDWAGAVPLLERAVSCKSDEGQSWVWLGQAYQNSGNRAKAVESYRKALEIMPGQPDAKKGIEMLSRGSN